MRGALARGLALLTGDARADRVVPPAGAPAWLTLLTAAAMAFSTPRAVAPRASTESTLCHSARATRSSLTCAIRSPL